MVLAGPFAYTHVKHSTAGSTITFWGCGGVRTRPRYGHVLPLWTKEIWETLVPFVHLLHGLRPRKISKRTVSSVRIATPKGGNLRYWGLLVNTLQAIRHAHSAVLLNLSYRADLNVWSYWILSGDVDTVQISLGIKLGEVRYRKSRIG